MSGWSEADTQELATITEQIARLVGHERSTIWLLRSQGCPWSVIGAALGVSRQAAQQRFGYLDDLEAD